jgi:hypothetical protein
LLNTKLIIYEQQQQQQQQEDISASLKLQTSPSPCSVLSFPFSVQSAFFAASDFFNR